MENIIFETISSAGSESTEPCRLPNSRSKISAVDKKRIIKAYEDGQNLKTVSEILNVNFGSLKNIIYRYCKTGLISTGKRGGHRKKIINEEMGDQLLEEIDKKPHMTLAEMKLFLGEKGLSTSITTIATFSKNRFYTFKKLRYSSAENLDLNAGSKFNQIKTAISSIVEEDRNVSLRKYFDELKSFYPACLKCKDVL